MYWKSTSTERSSFSCFTSGYVLGDELVAQVFAELGHEEVQGLFLADDFFEQRLQVLGVLLFEVLVHEDDEALELVVVFESGRVAPVHLRRLGKL